MKWLWNVVLLIVNRSMLFSLFFSLGPDFGCACRFAAALKDLSIWVMNVVTIDSPDTLPVIYERGLFGMYHDWCESFSTYPRSYDLLHADHLFSKVKKRCAEIFYFSFLITEILFI